MERKEITKKISGIQGDISVMRNILKSVETMGFPSPVTYESTTVAAAMRAEKIACALRHIIYSTFSISKRELMKEVATVHEIDINHGEGIFTVSLPSLLPKKKNTFNSEFITDPLHFALEEYFNVYKMEKFGECVVVFEHAYDANTPSRRIRDYDNVEVKPILDTVSGFVMTDDGGKFCDVFHTTKYGEKDCTKISVMGKNRFCEWVKNRENTVS